MAGSWDGSYDPGSRLDDGYQFERLHIEPMSDAFVCPLTKQVMHDPVSLENGQTFEREAIEKWFRECMESGRKLVCPLTLKELRSTDLNPIIALRNTIEEWNSRNEASEFDMARRSLSLGSADNDIMQALSFVQHLCQKSQSNKHVVRNAGLIPMIVDLLKSSSCRVRGKTLETLRIVAEEDSDNKEIMAEGDTVRTIVEFLTHEQSEEREEAVSLLCELSKSEVLSEKIGSINGAILILVGMTSSKSESILTVEKADKTLENLEKCENNVRQMAENGRLRPLQALLLEGRIPTEEEEEGENNVVKFLDSMDRYLTLLDSSSSTLRQGWLELASARHSMGASRINSALFDLKYHSAATSLQVALCNVDSTMKQPHFTLCKWLSPDNKNNCSKEMRFDEDELLQGKSTSPQLRHRGISQYSEIQEKRQKSNGSLLTVDNQAQKERSKLLSVFGGLVSPKLRAAQLSFETALEALVEIANMRSSMLSAYDQVQKEMESTMG